MNFLKECFYHSHFLLKIRELVTAKPISLSASQCRFWSWSIERRAEEESGRLGIRVRPSFNVELPPGFVLKKEMRMCLIWTRLLERRRRGPLECSMSCSHFPCTRG
ncbi:hypothetical protein GYH30_004063 [Glycine max]|uniref:Uncharacterized protein n=1 Tax=Glycine max TaxID=3847 RepID=A0A0R0L3T0_SOYBN|nr:hypothetical protein GYH30_004063 [Glycine max]